MNTKEDKNSQDILNIILDEVLRVFEIDREAIKGKSSIQELIECRSYFVCISRELTNFRFYDIAFTINKPYNRAHYLTKKSSKIRQSLTYNVILESVKDILSK